MLHGTGSKKRGYKRSCHGDRRMSGAVEEIQKGMDAEGCYSRVVGGKKTGRDGNSSSAIYYKHLIRSAPPRPGGVSTPRTRAAEVAGARRRAGLGKMNNICSCL